jgi:sulfur-carrier protein
MAIEVQLPSQLRSLAGGAARVLIEAENVAGLIEALAARHPGLKDRLLEPSGELRRFVRIFVNEEDIRFLRNEETPLAPGDTVAIVPAIAGG